VKTVKLAVCLLSCLSLALVVGTDCFSQDDDVGSDVDMVIMLLSDEDKDMRSAGLDTVRDEAKGKEATERFAALLPDLSPEAQVGLLSALADRGDKAARPAVIKALEGEAGNPVRVAAVSALGYLGETEDTPQLVKLLAEGTDEEKKAARASLVRLQGEGILPAIVDEMKKAQPPMAVTLIEILDTRRALDTIPDILAAAVGEDAQVRAAAMKALSSLAANEHVAGMVQGILKAERGRERDAAEKAVMVVCNRSEETDKRAEPLLAAYKQLSAAEQKTLMSTLGRVGGPDVLEIVKAAIENTDPEMHTLGIRALCNWPNPSVAPFLVALAEKDSHPDHQRSALRALIRVAPLGDKLTDAERLELLDTAMKMSTRDAERHLVLDRVRTVRCIESLRYIVPYLDQPEHAERACLSIVELAHYRDLREPNNDEFNAILDRVMEISKDEVVIDRAKRYKADQTWVRPKKKPAPPKPKTAKPAAEEVVVEEAAPEEAGTAEAAPGAEAQDDLVPIQMILAGVFVVMIILAAAIVIQAGKSG